MTTSEPSRLDRIERILETVAVRQDAFQSRMDNLADRQERTQQQLEQMGEAITDLTEMVGTVLHNMDETTAQIRAEFAADRAARAADQLAETQARGEFRRQMIGLQNESRNILRELADMRRRDSNGGRGS